MSDERDDILNSELTAEFGPQRFGLTKAEQSAANKARWAAMTHEEKKQVSADRKGAENLAMKWKHRFRELITEDEFLEVRNAAVQAAKSGDVKAQELYFRWALGNPDSLAAKGEEATDGGGWKITYQVVASKEALPEPPTTESVLESNARPNENDNA